MKRETSFATRALIMLAGCIVFSASAWGQQSTAQAISGRITAYDRVTQKAVSMADVPVRLKELKLETKSGTNGAYVFRNLPAGTYTLVATYGGKEILRTVVVPSGPASLRDVDLDVGAK